jgi:hypothetical protein
MIDELSIYNKQKRLMGIFFQFLLKKCRVIKENGEVDRER